MNKIDLKLPKSVLLVLSILLFVWINYLFYQYFFNYCERISFVQCRVSIALSFYWSATLGWLWVLLVYFYIRTFAFIASYIILFVRRKNRQKNGEKEENDDDTSEHVRLTNKIIPKVLRIILISALASIVLFYVVSNFLIPYLI